MKKYIGFLLILLVLLVSGCSDGSQYRGESVDEKRNEARIEAELYEMEQYKEAYNEGGLYAIYCFEGIIQSIRSDYISEDVIYEILELIESRYGEEAAEDIRDCIDVEFIDIYSMLEDPLKSLTEEFK